jgi:hypothetical protein
MQKDVVDQVVDFGSRHPRQHDTMHHSHVTIVETPKRLAVTVAGGKHEQRVFRGLGWRAHGLTFPIPALKSTFVPLGTSG